MTEQLKKDIFNKFRLQLPNDISDKVIERVVDESYSRISRPFYEANPEYLLDNDVEIEIDDEFFEGDIHLSTSGQYGLSWIFDKNTGEQHTS